MLILVCTDEDTVGEAHRVIGARARLLRTLDASVVTRMLLTGEATRLIVDPQCASADFVSAITSAVIRSECRVLLWTHLTPHHIPAILRANLIPYVDVLFRSRKDPADLLREYVGSSGTIMVRATLLRLLAPILRPLPSALATDVLKVLLREIPGPPIRRLLQELDIRRRNFERELVRANLCSINALMHLGRILSAYDYLSRGSGGVEAAAIAVGYPAGRDLTKNCRKFIGCRPSEFGSAISIRGVADRAVEVIGPPRPQMHRVKDA